MLFGGVARMRGRYYYFCSGGSIFTVSTVGRKGRRMGKYMKRAKSLKNMEVSQSSLLGVRTRARALGMEKQTSESIHKHNLTSCNIIKPRKSSLSNRTPSNSEPHYMQLRSRRLEKVTRHCEVKPEDGQNQNELDFEGRNANQNSVALRPFASTPSQANLPILNELLATPARNSCSSRPDFFCVGGSSAAAANIEDASHSRVASPAQSSLQASCHLALPSTSTPMPTMQGRGASRMVTRHQQQELDSKLSADARAVKMDTEGDIPEAANPPDNLDRDTEVGPCFGESPMIAGLSGRERQQGPNTRSQKRDFSLDTIIQKEVPGSTSRTGESAQMRSSSALPLSRSTEAPFSAEIEAFFASAEQDERRRFIDRYNFDPLTEKPLKGRYLWLKE